MNHPQKVEATTGRFEQALVHMDGRSRLPRRPGKGGRMTFATVNSTCSPWNDTSRVYA